MSPDVLNKSFFPDLIKHLLPSPAKLLTSALPNELGRAPAMDEFNDGRQNKYSVLFNVVLPSISVPFFRFILHFLSL